MKRCIPLLFLVLVISCQKGAGPGNNNNNNPGVAQTYPDVAYGSDAKQKIDIYLPAGRTTATTRVILLIHGGAWSSGDKTDFSTYVDTLKNRLPDYAIININYRLASGAVNLFPTQENDVAAAVAFIYGKRNEYTISDKFVLLGASAGGHLSLLHAYKYPTPVKIKAVVDFFGPVDLEDMYNHPASVFAPPAAVAAVIGGTPASNPGIYQQSSPLNFVTAQSPPTIIFQGGVDPLVAPSQAVALDAKLQAMGVVHQYIFYPTESHGWVGANLTHSFNAIQVFLAANVN
jgi:acetyl esterase/lipase